MTTSHDLSSSWPRIAAAFVATALLFSCGGGGGGSDPNSISGFVIFVPQTGPILGPGSHDTEPNDSVDQPQVIGTIETGRSIQIGGEIGAADDNIDAYAFVAPQRVAITALLVFEGARPSRVQLGVFDPVAMQLAQAPLAGGARFVARGAFDLVVRASGGSGRYTLMVTAAPAPAILDRAGWVGDMSVGDALSLSATGESTWTATSAEAQDLVVRTPAGSSVRARNLSSGTETTISGGEARIELEPLARMEFAAHGAAPFTFTVASQAPLSATSRRALARLPEPAAERIAWNANGDDALYSRAGLEAMPGQVLVRARGGADIGADIAARDCDPRDVIPGIAQLVAATFSPAQPFDERARATIALVRSFALSPRVEYAEPNFIRRAQGTAFTPNDTFYNPQLQWHFPLIRLPQAWGVFSGTTDSIVAVIDSGQRPHPDLDANTITGYDFISDPAIAGDGDGRDTDPFDEGDGQGPAPSSFHGTHVAGTIAAVTNNATGVAGVCGPANHTRVMHLRVLGIGGGTDADIAQAVLYAAHLPNGSATLPAQRADVINMSLGGPGSTATLQNAVNAAFTAGVTVFAAAGNNNSGAAFYPAAYNNVVSVSAIDINSAKAPYSNFSATVDLCAPGGDTTVDVNGDTYPDGVLSTLIVEATGAPLYVFYQGTSMACPHAAGLAALMHSQDPTLTPALIESKLKTTAVDLGAPGQDPIFGFGRIDAYQALVSAGAGTLAAAPALDLVPTTLDFGSGLTELTFQVLNTGGGLLDVGVIDDDAPWLTLAEVPSSDGTTDVGAVTCTVDRTGLSTGTHTATVTVNADNGTVPVRTVSIIIEVVPVVVPKDVDLFVLAVDSTTFDTIQQVVVNPTTGLTYAFNDLPRGDYFVICGSDEDPSDGICGPNDIYCGAYPMLDQPQAIHLDDTQITNLHFVVAPTSSTKTGASGRTYGVSGP